MKIKIQVQVQKLKVKVGLLYMMKFMIPQNILVTTNAI